MYDLSGIVTIPHTRYVFNRSSIVGVSGAHFRNERFCPFVGLTVYGVGFSVFIERRFEVPEELLTKYLERERDADANREIIELGTKLANEWYEETVRTVFADRMISES